MWMIVDLLKPFQNILNSLVESEWVIVIIVLFSFWFLLFWELSSFDFF